MRWRMKDPPNLAMRWRIAAKKLGRNTSDKTTCWVEELRRVHGHWGVVVR